jgi:hypothetical protein
MIEPLANLPDPDWADEKYADNQLFFHLGMHREANQLVKKYHYSGRPVNPIVCGTFHAPGGLFGTIGEAVAACIFASPPTRWSEPVLELLRLVRCENPVPLSQLISYTVKAVKQKRISDLLVSFADNTQDHHGGVYQACSWNYHGLRNRQMDGVVVDGAFVPGRTAVARYGTRSPERLASVGIRAEPHYDEGKHLYWKSLNKSGKRRAERLGLVSSPYPKPSAQGGPLFAKHEPGPVSLFG